MDSESEVRSDRQKRDAAGYLAMVLHAHLPFVRHPEHADSLEENWLFEGITETYIPLLLMLDELADKGVEFSLTISISPTLASMFVDPLLQSRYLQRLEKLISLASKETKRTALQPSFNALSNMYLRRLVEVRDAFLGRYNRDLIGAFGRLQQTGTVEIITSSATHCYLPLLSGDDVSIRAQVRTGIETHFRLFGEKPKGFWLPECGFCPGIDRILAEEGILYTIVETHGITRADPGTKYGVYAPVYCPSGLAVFGRDPESSKQVWSATEGYPGDEDYREFYRDIAYDLDLDYISPYIHPDAIRIDSGLKYYRITGRTEHKEVYDPQAAERKAEIHASDFISYKGKQVKGLAHMERHPIIVAPFDAELFGHWWHEGPRWLYHVIRKIAASNAQKSRGPIRLITLSKYLEEYPVNQLAVPSISSWGDKGSNSTWINESNDWIYPHLHRAAEMMKELAAKYPKAVGVTRRALDQAARELLQAQASDWAFMISTGSHKEYATERTKTHLLRLIRIKEQVDNGEIDEAWLADIEELSNIFPAIDYKLYK